MDGYDKTAKYYSNQREKLLRHFLREEFGTRKYMISRGGLVSVYGVMPNTNQEGWWFLGSVKEAEQRYNL